MRLQSERHWKHPYLTADEAKDKILAWGQSVGWGGTKEIEGLADGRLDVLLFPLSMDAHVFKALGRQATGDWTDRLGLAGVEVKVARADFLNGLREGQFDRYSKSLAGLYLAGPPDVVRSSEVPAEHGVLHLGGSLFDGIKLVCRRHPRWQKMETDTSQLWRLLWRLQADFRKRERELREAYAEKEIRFRQKAGDCLGAAINKAMRQGERG